MTLWFPPVSVLVVYVACPPVSVPVPTGEPSMLKVTVSPFGGAGDTVAVKVTDCP